ncbi:MAG: hypothetical protein AAGA48_28525 [Myxococcota bacterium]
MSAPHEVVWHEDGFSLPLGRLRRPHDEGRYVWAMTIPLYVLALAIEYTLAGSVFVLGTALVLFARQAMWLDERMLRLSGFGLQIGRHRVGADELLGCELQGHSLVIRTRRRTWPLPVGGLTGPERRWLCDEITALWSRWQARKGDVPVRIRRLTTQARVTAPSAPR